MLKGKENEEHLHNALNGYIGRRIRLRRILMKLTQENLAHDLGVSFQQVQKYETGKSSISVTRLYKIASILDVNLNFFTEGFLPEENVSAAECENDQLLGEIETFATTKAGCKLITSFLVLSPIERRRVLEILSTFAQSRQELETQIRRVYDKSSEAARSGKRNGAASDPFEEGTR